MKRYLTKSRFKLACECATKLYYTGKSAVYLDKSFDDEFLAALAEGGFQVGELAKGLYPDGHDIEDLDYATSLRKTAELLERENVVIFEPAFLHDGLFVRVDVLVKTGDRVQLIEVKAKSCSGSSESQFFGKKVGTLKSNWRPYLEDVAFQGFVLSQAHPEWEIEPYLMLVNKEAVCPTNGLHQKFLLTRDESGRAQCQMTAPLETSEAQSGLLVAVPVAHSLEIIQSQSRYGPGEARNFDDWIAYLAQKYQADERIWVAPTSACKGCQFQASDEERNAGMKSGFRECWKYAFDLSEAQMDLPTVLDVWNSRQKNSWLEEGRIHLTQLDESDFAFTPDPSEAIERKERQWIQVEKTQHQDSSFDLRPALADEMATWRFPLHFIDFETMSPAIPMHAGCRPYEVLAFQFSHHAVHENGIVEHVGEYIEDRVGAFPNIDFVRALKRELDQDEGTIFRYAPHENTVLCSIREQLLRDRSSHSDSAELIAFIESITQPPGRDPNAWAEGPRNMVDMLELVKRFYYDPRMGGSNSIKQVLPAVLNASEFLRNKYSNGIYGVSGGIPSKNFQEQIWVQEVAGEIVDPYKLLPTMFEGFSSKDREELLSREGSIDNGGAAMTAYARMQFTQMGEAERAHLRSLLLKYCELDTLAMVMIYEAWREWLGPA